MTASSPSVRRRRPRAALATLCEAARMSASDPASSPARWTGSPAPPAAAASCSSAGHVGADGEGGGADAPFATQVTRALDHFEHTLANAGLGFSVLLKVNVYLADIADFAEFNEIYLARYPAPRPARTTVQTPLAQGWRFEIDGVAVDER